MTRHAKIKILLVFGIHLILFSYFIQGGGSNQNATVCEIRSLVETGHVNINKYISITGDRVKFEGNYYSNKTPSVGFFATPLYYVFYNASKLLGIDTTSSSYKFAAIHFITFFSASIWGALIGLFIFFLIGEVYPKLKENDKIILSLLFPISTMIFPYSTMAFFHSYEVFWSLSTFYFFIKFIRSTASDSPESTRYIILAGISFSLTVLANAIFVLISPVIYYSFLKLSKNRLKYALYFSVFAFITLIPLLMYNYILYHNPLTTARSFQGPEYSNPNNLLGVFWIPRPGRVLKVLFWSYRSLPPTQTYILFFIPGLYFFVKEKIVPKQVYIYMVTLTCIYFIFMTSFNGWHGGVAFGPRYISILLPIFLVWSIPMYIRLKRTFIALMSLSFVMMLILTSVDPLWCCTEAFRFPFFEHSLPNFLKGNIAMNMDKLFISDIPLDYSFNIGHLLGLNGLNTLIPLILVISFLMAVLLKFLKRDNR